MKNKSNSPIFGSKEWLQTNYIDIDVAVKCSKKSEEFKSVESLVAAVRNDDNKMYVYEVFRTKGECDEKLVKTVIAHISLGLNGSGRQVDYLEALQRLVMNGNAVIIDVRIDACDDILDFLVMTRRETCELGKKRRKA